MSGLHQCLGGDVLTSANETALLNIGKLITWISDLLLCHNICSLHCPSIINWTSRLIHLIIINSCPLVPDSVHILLSTLHGEKGNLVLCRAFHAIKETWIINFIRRYVINYAYFLRIQGTRVSHLQGQCSSLPVYQFIDPIWRPYKCG